MKDVLTYLREYIDDKADIKAVEEQRIKGLPIFLLNTFDYYELNVMDENALLIKPLHKQTAYRLRNWINQIEEISGMKVVLLLDDATPYMIKKMIMDRTAFVVPGKQLYLPFLMMMIKTERNKPMKTIRKFSPVTQLIFLYILYSDSSSFSIGQLASELSISTMSSQRGLSELENLGLLSSTIQGKTGRKKVFERIDTKDFYNRGKNLLDNPISNIVYVSEFPENLEYVLSDLSALSEQTMLGEPGQKRYALYNKSRKMLDDFIVSDERALEEKLPLVQLMKYDVNKLSRNNLIDPISMMLCLTESDERIEMAIDELMEGYNWYTNEDD